ncbi:MAG: hypothetical protein PVJ02_14230 [Gemmatimonadota bacterium]|jgi:hypothetical protein
MHRLIATATAALALILPGTAAGQVDTLLARRYFAEADSACRAEGGATWGVSLCGPMVFADARTGSIATNEPAPDAPRPRVLGFANAAWKWGDQLWSTFVWSMISPDSRRQRIRLFMHELFHRVQPELGLLDTNAQPPNHLDTEMGRYWMQLEWRALARALTARGDARRTAIADALAFRATRRGLFDGAAASEHASETTEGLAQYTGTIAAADTKADAIADAVRQLQDEAEQESFVKTFAYPSGAAYGLLLDAYAPGWPHSIRRDDDIGALLATAAGVTPSADADAAALRYGGAALRAAEAKREARRQARVTALRKRFVDGPIVVVPRGSGASFMTRGVTPLDDAGTVVPQFRVSGPWGSLQAKQVLMSPDQSLLTVPGPPSIQGDTLTGDGWTLVLKDGWTIRTDGKKVMVVPVKEPGADEARRHHHTGGTTPRQPTPTQVTARSGHQDRSATGG